LFIPDEVKSLKIMKADTEKHTKVQMGPELECTTHCTMCPYETTQLES
jgi:hypothetical protein